MKTYNIITKYIPLKLLFKVTNVKIIMPFYHVVSSDEVCHVKHLYKYKNIKSFNNDIEYIGKNYKPLSLNDLINVKNINQKMPGQYFFLSFDDGLKEIYDIAAPILLKKGIPATFFINSDFIDNKKLCFQHKASLLISNIIIKNSKLIYSEIGKILNNKNIINVDNIKNIILSIDYKSRYLLDTIAEFLSVDFNDYLNTKKPYLTTEQTDKLIHAGFTIGGHSVDHPTYASLSIQEQLAQTIESVTFIKNRFSLQYGAFSFPNTDANITGDFFSKLHASGEVEVSFGNSGMLQDTAPHHFQRFNAEKRVRPIQDEIAFQLVRRVYKHSRNDHLARC